MSDITDAGPRLRAMNDAMENERLLLTNAERQAIQYFAAFHGSPREGDAKAAAMLQALLDRMKIV